MNSAHEQFLNLKTLPARLKVEEVAWPGLTVPREADPCEHWIDCDAGDDAMEEHLLVGGSMLWR